ncbi:unnamed protein product [Symbiodinium sp. KB8]|nr:unnamed protein product [Symbiodinium sp. KB8]
MHLGTSVTGLRRLRLGDWLGSGDRTCYVVAGAYGISTTGAEGNTKQPMSGDSAGIEPGTPSSPPSGAAHLGNFDCHDVGMQTRSFATTSASPPSTSLLVPSSSTTGTAALVWKGQPRPTSITEARDYWDAAALISILEDGRDVPPRHGSFRQASARCPGHRARPFCLRAGRQAKGRQCPILDTPLLKSAGDVSGRPAIEEVPAGLRDAEFIAKEKALPAAPLRRRRARLAGPTVSVVSCASSGALAISVAAFMPSRVVGYIFAWVADGAGVRNIDRLASEGGRPDAFKGQWTDSLGNKVFVCFADALATVLVAHLSRPPRPDIQRGPRSSGSGFGV